MKNGGPCSINGPEQPAPEPHHPFGEITQKDVDDYRALAVREVHLLSLRWGDIYIVLERSDRKRFEILPEELKILVNAYRLFDATVVQVRSSCGT